MTDQYFDYFNQQVENWLSARDNFTITDWQEEVEAWETPRMFLLITQAISRIPNLADRAMASSQLINNYKQTDSDLAIKLTGIFSLSDTNLNVLIDALTTRLNNIAIELGYTSLAQQESFCAKNSEFILASRKNEADKSTWYNEFLAKTFDYAPGIVVQLADIVNDAENKDNPEFDIADLDSISFVEYFAKHFVKDEEFVGYLNTAMLQIPQVEITNLINSMKK